MNGSGGSGNHTSLRDIGDCTNELMSMDVKLETVSELCSNCGTFVTVQIDPASADPANDTVYFKCTSCNDTLSYVVEKPKVEPAICDIKTEQQQTQRSTPPGVDNVIDNKVKVSSAALRSFRKQPKPADVKQQPPPSTHPPLRLPTGGKPKALPNDSSKPVIKPKFKLSGGKPMQMPSDIKSKVSDFELDFKPKPQRSAGGGKPKSLMIMMADKARAASIEPADNNVCAVAPEQAHHFPAVTASSGGSESDNMVSSAEVKSAKTTPTVGVVKPRVVVKIKLSDKAIMKLDKIKSPQEPPEKKAKLEEAKKSKCSCDPKEDKKCKHCRKKAKKEQKDKVDLPPLPANLQIIPVKSSSPPVATVTSGLFEKQEKGEDMELNDDDDDDIQVIEEKPVTKSDVVSPLRLFRKKPASSSDEGGSSDSVKKCLVKLTRIDKSKEENMEKQSPVVNSAPSPKPAHKTSSASSSNKTPSVISLVKNKAVISNNKSATLVNASKSVPSPSNNKPISGSKLSGSAAAPKNKPNQSSSGTGYKPPQSPRPSPGAIYKPVPSPSGSYKPAPSPGTNHKPAPSPGGSSYKPVPSPGANYKPAPSPNSNYKPVPSPSSKQGSTTSRDSLKTAGAVAKSRSSSSSPSPSSSVRNMDQNKLKAATNSTGCSGKRADKKPTLGSVRQHSSSPEVRRQSPSSVSSGSHHKASKPHHQPVSSGSKQPPMVSIPKSGLHALMKSDKWSKNKGSYAAGSGTKSDSKHYHKPASANKKPVAPTHTMPSFSKLKSGFTIPKSGGGSGVGAVKESTGTTAVSGDSKASQVHNPVTVKPVPNVSAYQTSKPANSSGSQSANKPVNTTLGPPAGTSTTFTPAKPGPARPTGANNLSGSPKISNSSKAATSGGSAGMGARPGQSVNQVANKPTTTTAGQVVAPKLTASASKNTGQDFRNSPGGRPTDPKANNVHNKSAPPYAKCSGSSSHKSEPLTRPPSLMNLETSPPPIKSYPPGLGYKSSPHNSKQPDNKGPQQQQPNYYDRKGSMPGGSSIGQQALKPSPSSTKPPSPHSLMRLSNLPPKQADLNKTMVKNPFFQHH